MENNTTPVASSDDKIIYKFNLIFSLILFFTGLVLVGLSAFYIYDFYKKSENYVELNAVISSYESNNSGLRAAIITYEVDGEKYDLRTKKFVQIPESIGTIVSVKYNPDKPSEAMRNGDTINFIFPTVSILVFLVGFIKLIRVIRSKSKKKKEVIEEEKPKEEKKEVVEAPKFTHKVAPDQQTIGELRLPSNKNDDNWYL